MKRDPLSATQARAPVDGTHRVPKQRARAVEVVHRQHLHTVLRALLQRAMSAEDLVLVLARAYPGEVIRIGGVIERGLANGWLQADPAGLLGLTAAGDAYANDLPSHRLVVPPDPKSEAERRIALCHDPVAAAALTRSHIRAAASPADLRPPPPRQGADAGLEIPSRFGNTLRYRDGRITDLQGNAL